MKYFVLGLIFIALIVVTTITSYMEGKKLATQCHADCVSQLNELVMACEKDVEEHKGFIAEVTKAREECRTELLDCQQVVQTAYIEKATEIKDNR